MTARVQVMGDLRLRAERAEGDLAKALAKIAVLEGQVANAAFVNAARADPMRLHTTSPYDGAYFGKDQ